MITNHYFLWLPITDACLIVMSVSGLGAVVPFSATAAGMLFGAAAFMHHDKIALRHYPVHNCVKGSI